MPLKEGSGKKVVHDNVSEIMNSYFKTGKIGASAPASKEKAQKQAVAVAYSKAREKKR